MELTSYPGNLVFLVVCTFSTVLVMSIVAVGTLKIIVIKLESLYTILSHTNQILSQIYHDAGNSETEIKKISNVSREIRRSLTAINANIITTQFPELRQRKSE